MTRWLCFALGATLLVCAGIAVDASGAPAAPGANERTYVDERGEAVGAPDITNVIVSNDDSGLITFRLITPNRQRLTKDMRVRIWLTARGTTYFLLADPLPPNAGVGLFGCEERSTGLVCFPTGSPSLRFRYVRGARFTFDLSEIGIGPVAGARTPMGFWASIYSGVRYEGRYDFTRVRIDRAPSRDGRSWTYLATFGPD